MKVSELANELGRTSKEIIEVIKKKEGTGALYAASTMTKEQESAARSAFAAKKRSLTPPCSVGAALMGGKSSGIFK